MRRFGIFVLALIWACGGQQSSPEETPVYRETIDFPARTDDAQVVPLQQIDLQRIKQSMTIPEDVVYRDVFRQQEVIPPMIDILVIMDNSFSMEEEQMNLSDKLSYLISDLSQVDWQINVITTDNDCKRIEDLPLTPDSEGMETKFKDAVRAGTGGDSYEMGLERSVSHLEGACSSDAPWVRDGADFAILLVTDEDEDMFSDYYEESELYISTMKDMGYVGGENFKFYGIIGHPTKPCPTAFTLAKTIANVIDLTDGLWGSICDADYSRTLRAISRDIRMNLKIDFPLSFAPVISTIKLELDGSDYPGEWTVVGQRVILADPLPEGATLIIEYQVESYRLLQLGADPETFVLESISLNGEPLADSRYQYDPVGNTVLLAFDPDAGDVIHTQLIENKQLPSRFDFPVADAAYIKCFIENEPWPAELTLTSEGLMLEPTIPAGRQAHCLYNR